MTESSIEHHGRPQTICLIFIDLYTPLKDIVVLSLTSAKISSFSIALEAVHYLHLYSISPVYLHFFLINVVLKY